ncbi:MAG: bacteriohopanetetrol glucosamine biosynthesis glycosyltransferase HpnI [Burkholderiaceae bacterium]|jgi:ceramide glucosyltransferase
MPLLLTLLGGAFVVAACGYAVLALLSPRPRMRATAGDLLPVTVLKPLCGVDERLEENLEALCVQTHPAYQVVCGVRDPSDAAIGVVMRLKSRYPDRVIDLVVHPGVHGSNLKVSNLINMWPHARHDAIVIADSDIHVAPDYLERVVRPLSDPTVGLVTCLYRGRPAGSMWARVGALFIDTWFLPSVRVAHGFGVRTFGFGATMALRRNTLEELGGLEVLRNRLADDYWLGHFVRGLGQATLLSDVCVTTDVSETRLGELWTRELRWLRTIRSLNPVGFFFTFITYTFPIMAIGLALSPSALNASLAVVAVMARLGLHWRRPAPGLPRAGMMRYAALRDCLLLAGWAYALLGTHVQWRRQILPLRDRSADPYP